VSSGGCGKDIEVEIEVFGVLGLDFFCAFVEGCCISCTKISMRRKRRSRNSEVEVGLKTSVPENFKKGLLQQLPHRNILVRSTRQNFGKRVVPTRPPPPLPPLYLSTSPTHPPWLRIGASMSQDEALRDRLKASLWFSIGKIVDEETARLNTTATPQFIGAMTEMVWAQIGESSSPPI
jgi:hypothetical protein